MDWLQNVNMGWAMIMGVWLIAVLLYSNATYPQREARKKRRLKRLEEARKNRK